MDASNLSASLCLFWKSLGQALFQEDSQWTSHLERLREVAKEKFSKELEMPGHPLQYPVIIPTPVDHTSLLPGRSALWATLQGKQKDREARRKDSGC